MLFYLGLTTLVYALHFNDIQTKAWLGFSKAMLFVDRRLRFELISSTGDTESYSIYVVLLAFYSRLCPYRLSGSVCL